MWQIMFFILYSAVTIAVAMSPMGATPWRPEKRNWIVNPPSGMSTVSIRDHANALTQSFSALLEPLDKYNKMMEKSIKNPSFMTRYIRRGRWISREPSCFWILPADFIGAVREASEAGKTLPIFNVRAIVPYHEYRVVAGKKEASLICHDMSLVTKFEKTLHLVSEINEAMQYHYWVMWEFRFDKNHILKLCVSQTNRCYVISDPTVVLDNVARTERKGRFQLGDQPTEVVFTRSEDFPEASLTSFSVNLDLYNSAPSSSKQLSSNDKASKSNRNIFRKIGQFFTRSTEEEKPTSYVVCCSRCGNSVFTHYLVRNAFLIVKNRVVNVLYKPVSSATAEVTCPTVDLSSNIKKGIEEFWKKTAPWVAERPQQLESSFAPFIKGASTYKDFVMVGLHIDSKSKRVALALVDEPTKKQIRVEVVWTKKRRYFILKINPPKILRRNPYITMHDPVTYEVTKPMSKLKTQSFEVSIPESSK